MSGVNFLPATFLAAVQLSLSSYCMGEQSSSSFFWGEKRVRDAIIDYNNSVRVCVPWKKHDVSRGEFHNTVAPDPHWMHAFLITRSSSQDDGGVGADWL